MARKLAQDVAAAPRVAINGRFERHVSQHWRELTGSNSGGRWGPAGGVLGPLPRQTACVRHRRGIPPSGRPFRRRGHERGPGRSSSATHLRGCRHRDPGPPQGRGPTTGWPIHRRPRLRGGCLRRVPGGRSGSAPARTPRGPRPLSFWSRRDPRLVRATSPCRRATSTCWRGSLERAPGRPSSVASGAG